MDVTETIARRITKMNLEGLNIAVFKNAYKKEDRQPDYNIVIRDGEEVVAEGGAYIATDRQTGEKKRDKNGKTYMLGKLKAPRDRQSPPASEPEGDQDPDADVPF